MKIWRTARGRYLVECDECSSRGHPMAVRTTFTQDQVVADKWAEHLARADKLRAEHQAALGAVVRLRRADRLTPQEASQRMKTLSEKHAAGLKSILETAPNIREGIAETAEKCPWCDHEERVIVVDLPEGVEEPSEWVKKEGVT